MLNRHPAGATNPGCHNRCWSLGYVLRFLEVFD
jgi:hypothetical protein